MKKVLLAAACLWLSVVPGGAQQKPAAEVTSGDWSYTAIQGLASRGLVHGYKDARFLTGKLTRFEMAALIKRVLDNVLALPDPGAAGLPASEAPGTAAARGQGVEPAPRGRPLSDLPAARTAEFREADLATVKRLAEAYSVELAIIGVNLQDAMDRIQRLEGRVDEIEKTLKDPKGPLQKAIADLARIDRLRFSGYVQGRYESFENTREAVGANPASRPAVTDRFTVRRVRLVAAARPTDRIAARLQIEGAGSAGGTAGTVELRDAYIEYFFTGNPATGYTATLGQLKVPFGFELAQSSSTREAPERGRVARFFFPDERDRGFKLVSPTGGKVFYEVGVFNGTAPGRTGRNANDNNNDKDFAGRVRTTLAKRVDVGASFNYGTSLRTELAQGEPNRAGGAPSAANPYENHKVVYGADLQWLVRDGTIFRAEWMGGKANGTRASGYIVQLIQDLGEKWQVVAKYDWLGAEKRVLFPIGAGGTPIGDAVGYQGTASALALGLIHQLDRSTRVKVFYEIHDLGNERLTGYGPGGGVGRVPFLGNILRVEVITLF